MITGQMGRLGKERKEGGKRGELGSAQFLFFPVLVFSLLTEFEKRRKEIKAKVKFRVLILPQHKMLVKMQIQNNILICFVQNRFWLLINLFCT